MQVLCSALDNLPVRSGIALERLKALWVTGLLLPMTILTLATSETLNEGRWKRTSWLGEISYSSYLLHFPLQLAFFNLFSGANAGREIFYHPLLWIGYFTALIALSLLVHRYFERPLQHWVRRASLRKTGRRAAPVS